MLDPNTPVFPTTNYWYTIAFPNSRGKSGWADARRVDKLFFGQITMARIAEDCGRKYLAEIGCWFEGEIMHVTLWDKQPTEDDEPVDVIELHYKIEDDEPVDVIELHYKPDVVIFSRPVKRIA